MAKDWCAVRVRSGTESKVVSMIEVHCSGNVLDVFVPSMMISSLCKSSNKFASFSGYLFIKTKDKSAFADKIEKIRALCRLLTVDDKPIAISDEEVNEMRAAIEESDDGTYSGSINVGANVKVVQGPFEGYTGRVESLDSSGRAKIKIPFCGQDVEVTFNLDKLKITN
jgi:transcriptional antiterminator NusG